MEMRRKMRVNDYPFGLEMGRGLMYILRGLGD